MHKSPKNVDYHFLIRVLNNDISPEEKEYFEDWLSESEKNREDFGTITLLWDKISSSKYPPLPDPQEQWQKISSSVNAQLKNVIELEKVKRTEPTEDIKPVLYQFDGYQTDYWKSIYSSRMIQIAALILIFFTAGLLVFKSKFQKESNYYTQQIRSIPPIEIQTRKGEKVSLTLSDGSKVYLNTLSTLKYPEFFSETSRDVELEGEAYFAVTPNKNRPFRVKSGNTLTVVRGTEFNIKNRGESISVVVVKGSVDTYNPTSEKIFNLKKGDLISYNERTGFSNLRRADLQHYLAWRKDKFSFSRTPLKEVMEEIGRYYNVDVRFKADSLKNKTITGFFSSGSINKILSIISLTLDLKISMSKGNTITIDNK
jgi:ferric-dicitrate binding protein FerR (iron transport regulator)